MRARSWLIPLTAIAATAFTTQASAQARSVSRRLSPAPARVLWSTPARLGLSAIT